MPQNPRHPHRLKLGKTGSLLWLPLLSIVLAAPPTWGQETPAPNNTSLPSLPLLNTVDAIEELRQALSLPASSPIQTGAVTLDGRRLFLVTAPQGDPGSTPPVSQRIRSIEQTLRRLAAMPLDLDTLEVSVVIDAQTNQPVVQVNGQYLLTVTSLDAQLQGTQAIDWAEQVADIVEQALRTSQQERQPQFLRRQGLIALGILLAVWGTGRLCQRERRRLTQQRDALQAEYSAIQAEMQERLQEEQQPGVDPILMEQQAQRKRQESYLELQIRLLRLVQVGVWIGGVGVSLGLFPQTRALQTFFLVSLRGPLLRLAGVGFATYGSVWLSGLVLDNLFAALRQEQWQNAPTTPTYRLSKRLSTFAGVAKGIAATTLILVGSLVGLALVGVNIGPLVASLGFIGLGISLAAQDLIKDIINGLLILLEDQFAEGDVIVVDGRGGLVEHMDLRLTQLRNTEGTLISIPNSAIRVVENLSNGWSRVDLGIEIAYENDLEQAMRITEQVALEMYREPVWREKILDLPEMHGVDHLGERGVTLRLWIKVQPLQQWKVAREYRRRLKHAFDQAGIQIPFPQQTLGFRTPLQMHIQGLSSEETQRLLHLMESHLHDRSSPYEEKKPSSESLADGSHRS
ncbi:mechanosensitive ion channel family protein [Thermostichus vulcanus]|uniref:Mechanosensitive ion channel family protein n=1 Tax=Thermostichus vulcanus str. 'Rupite' TaxID=2813851 RepID=A0ABT0C9K8_THEVL|nr:mechanosensitive ion channel family protein [Thermostichus vulcanus]MCJ2542035.1 mechanosensitive ion channel family protein [Thermostichus vulcanus str. 'Rupite']